MKKEKILINIENLNDYYEYKKIGYNNFLFAIEEFSIGYNTFKLDSIKDLECKKYLLINKIFDNKTVEKFKGIINELKYFDGIIFEDIAVYNILKDMNIKLIWNQKHFATNYSSINYWLDNTYSAVISNELTKEEVREILDKTNKPLILNVFGKNEIMYSRRQLLTNFDEYYNLKHNNKRIIKDKVTQNEYLGLESESGTLFLDNNYFNIMNYLDYFNSKNILYYLIYPKGLSIKEIENIINNKSDIKYNDGFMNKKTIYKLEVK